MTKNPIQFGETKYVRIDGTGGAAARYRTLCLAPDGFDVAVKRSHRWFPKSNLLTVGCLLANSALVS
jgi:hypothetical protein